MLLDALYYSVVLLIGHLAAAGGDEYNEQNDAGQYQSVDGLCTELVHTITMY